MDDANICKKNGAEPLKLKAKINTEFLLWNQNTVENGNKFQKGYMYGDKIIHMQKHWYLGVYQHHICPTVSRQVQALETGSMSRHRKLLEMPQAEKQQSTTTFSSVKTEAEWKSQTVEMN